MPLNVKRSTLSRAPFRKLYESFRACLESETALRANASRETVTQHERDLERAELALLDWLKSLTLTP